MQFIIEDQTKNHLGRLLSVDGAELPKITELETFCEQPLPAPFYRPSALQSPTDVCGGQPDLVISPHLSYKHPKLHHMLESFFTCAPEPIQNANIQLFDTLIISPFKLYALAVRLDIRR